MKAKFINCYEANEKLGQTTDSSYTDGSVSVKFIYKDADINYGKREYQREKVATVPWKQGILITILSNSFRSIPEIHIRVVKINDEYLTYELVDGQQRVTSITDFLSGLYPLPEDLIIDGKDVGGMYVEKLKLTYTDLYERILNYRISCKWYENISDIQTADLFVEVLNNTNDMKPQEIRNAVSGVFSTWVRDTARGDIANGVKCHKLFQTVGDENKKSLKYFGKFDLKGRMEIDQFLSELCFLLLKGFKNGISHAPHTAWVKDIQRPGGIYEDKFTDKKLLEKLLTFSYDIIKSVPKEYKTKLTPMLSQIMVLYANDLKSRYGKVIPSLFTKAFFSTYEKWSCDKKKLYMNETTVNGNQMMQFKDLFGGKNKNAIETICYVLNKELESDKNSFGIIEMDQREVFSDEDIYKKWKEQNMIDYYDGLPLEQEDAVGDHYIARSEGIDNGGVTEYYNLVVTSSYNNSIKSNMNAEAFMNQLRGK